MIQNYRLALFIGFIIAASLISPVYADPVGSCDPEVEFCNTITSGTFSEVMAKIAEVVAKIGLPIVVIMIIWAGFLFVTAGGNEEKLKTARNTFFWAVIGGLLVVGAYAIAIAIENFAQQL